MKAGSIRQSNGLTLFTLWAPYKKKVALKLVEPKQDMVEMIADEKGYWSTGVPELEPGQSYVYVLDEEKTIADPASEWQPGGIFGPSAVVDHQFEWHDQSWQNIPLNEYLIYECHVGTFTQEGTLKAIIGKLNYLKDLGITALELLPLAAFPGERNWGYDAVFPYAVQNNYGGPEALKQLVDACHRTGIAVILDVVYNHIGPEGNILGDAAPYFTDKYRTPWGAAMNYDDKDAYGARQFIIQNALYWIEHYHIDALRLDAVQTIIDHSDEHILSSVSEAVERYCQRSGRQAYLFAESDLNEMKVTGSRSQNGWGLDGNWCDDLHHALHAFFTGERQGYYVDFGEWEQLVKTIRTGYWFDGRYCKHRQKEHGNFDRSLDPLKLIVYGQNHDQIGNRLAGERLVYLLELAKVKIVATIIILSPHIPLLFMGEEYGETNPFLYFVDHHNEALLEAVRTGRKKEFAKFNWNSNPPDPGQTVTFLASKLDWSKLERNPHNELLAYYKKIISLRKQFRINESATQRTVWEDKEKKMVAIHYKNDRQELVIVTNFSKHHQDWPLEWNGTGWCKELFSSDHSWMDQGFDNRELTCGGSQPVVEPYSVTVHSKG